MAPKYFVHPLVSRKIVGILNLGTRCEQCLDDGLVADLEAAIDAGRDLRQGAPTLARGAMLSICNVESSTIWLRFCQTLASASSHYRMLTISPEMLSSTLLDEEGRRSFNTLQNLGSSGAPVFLYVFDVLVLAGRNVMHELLEIRRELLHQKILSKLKEPIRYSPELKAGLSDLIESVKARGLEGIVAKRRDSIYEPEQRSQHAMGGFSALVLVAFARFAVNLLNASKDVALPCAIKVHVDWVVMLKSYPSPSRSAAFQASLSPHMR